MSARNLRIWAVSFLCAVLPVLAHATVRFKTVPVGDIEIAYQDFGTGDPLVMIMGYGGSMDLWSPRLLQLLGQSHHVFIFDNRGMGHSTASEDEYSIPLFALDTLGFMDACGIQKATVLGWSMGAEVSQELEITYPDRVQSLVLISPSVGGKEQIPPDDDVLKKLGDTSGGPLIRGLRLLHLLFPNEWLNAHAAVWNYFPVNATMNPHESSLRQLKAIMDWAGSASRLHEIKCPTLIITGKEDIVFPTGNSTLLAAGIDGSRLVQFPDAGHGVMYQYTEKVAKEIDAFIPRSR
jgi:pimeloyl-ACP methyl ester carboxylesterase